MSITQSFKLGDVELVFLRDGALWVDGGGYFGIIPKVIWQKLMAVDDLNRVQTNINPLLVRTGKHNVLIDPGIGDKYSEKQQKIFNINYEPSLAQSLAEIGMTPDDIDVVVATHLHFDHVGACTTLNSSGNVVPTFQNAKHYFQQGEWEDATHPDERTRGTYFLENYVPVQEAGLVEFIEGDTEIVPGIRVEVTGGHTKYHQIVLIESQGEIAVYIGDIVPAVTHLRIPYTMGFDLYPAELMAKRRELYGRAIAEHWLVCLDHDPEQRAGYITFDGKNYQFDAQLLKIATKSRSHEEE